MFHGGHSLAALSATPPWRSHPRYLAPDAADGRLKGPALVADFRRGLFALPSLPAAAVAGADASALTALRPAAFADVFSFSSGGGTWFDAGGVMRTAPANAPRIDWSNGVGQLMLNGAATNLLLNSAALATQSVTTVSTTHTLSFWGTGSVTLSGTATGTLTGTGAATRVSRTFTATAGTLTLTVSGSVANAQLETQGFASPWIPTTTTAATRPIETCQFGAAALALVQRTAVTILARGRGIVATGGVYNVFVGSQAALQWLGTNNTGTKLEVWDGTANLDGGSTTTFQPYGAIYAQDGTSRAVCANGGTLGTDARTMQAPTVAYLGRATNVYSGAQYGDGWYDELVIWPFRVANANLQAKAVSYV